MRDEAADRDYLVRPLQQLFGDEHLSFQYKMKFDVLSRYKLRKQSRHGATVR